MTICSAYGCNNRLTKGCGKHFFRFPMKNPELLSQWVSIMRRKDWSPTIHSRLCSDHFTEEDYMTRPGASYPYLRLDAVPSIFPGFPSYLQKKLLKNKPKKKLTDILAEVAKEKEAQQEAAEIEAQCVAADKKAQCKKDTASARVATDHIYSLISASVKVRVKEQDPAKILLRKKVKRIQRQVQRQRHKIANLEQVIKQLKERLNEDVPVLNDQPVTALAQEL